MINKLFFIMIEKMKSYRETYQFNPFKKTGYTTRNKFEHVVDAFEYFWERNLSSSL